jgi:hypothetical protein
VARTASDADSACEHDAKTAESWLRGVIEKPFGSETILDSLRGALSRLVSPNEQAPAAAAAAEKLALLSAREREVLAGLVAGIKRAHRPHDALIQLRNPSCSGT